LSGATIKRVQLAAAHDGEAELVVVLSFENGGESFVALDEYAARALLESCKARTPEELVGAGWEHVRDALVASSNRFVETTG